MTPTSAAPKTPFAVSFFALALSGSAFAAIDARPDDVPLSVRTTNVGTHAVDDVDEWIENGRVQIMKGDFKGARTTLEQAAALEGGGSRSAVWLLRVRIEDGEWDEALDSISRLKRSGQNGPDVTYVTGMALAKKSQAALAAGDQSSIGFLMEDAKTALAEAIEAEPQRYTDAELELARVARLTGDSETSLRAAEMVVARADDATEAWDLLGRAALALGAESSSDEARADESAAYFERAVEAFNKALRLYGDAPSGTAAVQAADASLQLGTTYSFMQQLDDAGTAYGRALELAPDGVDIGVIYNALGDERFQPIAADIVAKYKDNDTTDAALRWWLGYSYFYNAAAQAEVSDTAMTEQLGKADEMFQSVLTKAPAYTNSYYYLMRVRYDAENFAGAADALLNYWKWDRVGAIDALGADEFDRLRVASIVASLVNAGRHEDGIKVTEMLTAAVPSDPQYWNNLGLLQRDWGEQRKNAMEDGDENERASVMALYEKSYESYGKALDLDPENPAYLNDTAVILHYYLERDYDEAMAMYERAAALADELLASEDLDPELRPIIEIAKRDANNNKAELRARMTAAE